MPCPGPSLNMWRGSDGVRQVDCNATVIAQGRHCKQALYMGGRGDPRRRCMSVRIVYKYESWEYREKQNRPGDGCGRWIVCAGAQGMPATGGNGEMRGLYASCGIGGGRWEVRV